MTRKQNQEKRELKNAAEKLLVDYELRNRASDNLDKVSYNIQKMEDNVDQQIKIKKDLLNNLKERRTSNNNFSSIQSDFINKDLRNKLRDAQSYTSKNLDLIEINNINTIDIDRDDFDSVEYNKEFAEKENINLDSPFLNLYSKNEQVLVSSQIIEKFDLLQLDKEDYGFAALAALFGGIIDTTLVGTISAKNPSILQKKVDNQFYNIVTKFSKNQQLAEIEQNISKAKSPESKEKLIEMKRKLESQKQTRQESISYLENKYKVKYDTVYDEKVDGMYINNHHNSSLAHDFSPLGLIIGILDQLSNKSTFIESNTGKIVRIATSNKNNEFDGNIFKQIISAVINWFGHCMSDIVGSSSSKGRGQGLPAPFWSYLQKLNIGKVKLANSEKPISYGKLTDWMFQNGYDFRAFTTELIPVIIFETLVRTYWFYKQFLYYGKSFKESLPIASSRELARLLLISSSTFSSIDTSHALVKSLIKGGGNINLNTFVMTVNKPGLLDLGFRSYQNVRMELEHRKTVERIMDEDIVVEYKRVMSSENIFE